MLSKLERVGFYGEGAVMPPIGSDHSALFTVVGE